MALFCYTDPMIIGIDEVGRGCWAGPLVASAVGFSATIPEGLNDSKKLSAKKRALLAGQITDATKYLGLGWVWPMEINEIGLTESVRLAMQRAYDALSDHSSESEIIIDGNINYLAGIAGTRAVIKADGSLAEASAASIIAKVARDSYMYEIAKRYPDYGFDSHVGYGTRQHIEALELYGVLPIHRVNYKPIQSIIAQHTV